jgi:O-antigen ligase
MIRDSRAPLLVVLAAVLLWAPLPFGGVVPWAAAVLQVAGFLALALAALAVSDGRALRAAAAPATALAALAVLGWLQSLAWPPGLVAALSPAHGELYRASAELAAPGEAGGGPSLSLAPAASRFAALTVAAAAGVLVAGAVAGRRRSGRRLLAGVLLLGAAFQVLYGAQRWFSRATEIWGVAVPGDATRLRGTYVNPNHLATYLLMALAAAFALAWWAGRRARWEDRPEVKLALVGPPVLLWLGLFVALAFTGSRAGLAAGLAVAALQAFLLARASRSWRPAAAGAALLGAGVAAILATGLREGLGRWVGAIATGTGFSPRLAAYEATLELWRRFPVLGTGLGTFRDGFPLVQPKPLEGTFWHAESDLLELLATAGLAGVAVAAVGLVAVARRLLALLLSAERSEERAAALAALGALAGVGLHELVDFGLTMPANAFTLAIVVGAALGSGARNTASVPSPPKGGTGSG